MTMYCRAADKTGTHTWSQIDYDSCEDYRNGVRCKSHTQSALKTVHQAVCVEGGYAPGETHDQWMERANMAWSKAIGLWRNIPLANDDFITDKVFYRYPLFDSDIINDPSRETIGPGIIRVLMSMVSGIRYYGGLSASENTYRDPN